MKTNKILAVVTNVDQFESTGIKTGLWLSELTKFSDTLIDAGYEVVIASPEGGKVPLDPQSLILTQVAGATGLRGRVTRNYESHTFMKQLNDTVKLADVSASDYDGIYLAGGHGAMYDFTNNKQLHELLDVFYQEKKVISAVCHGLAGFVDHPLVKGKKITGFSWREERLAKRTKIVPYNLEEKLKSQGAKYRKAKLPFDRKVVVSGRIVTGQNPMSTRATAKKVVKLLKKNKR